MRKGTQRPKRATIKRPTKAPSAATRETLKVWFVEKRPYLAESEANGAREVLEKLRGTPVSIQTMTVPIVFD